MKRPRTSVGNATTIACCAIILRQSEISSNDNTAMAFTASSPMLARSRVSNMAFSSLSSRASPSSPSSRMWSTFEKENDLTNDPKASNNEEAVIDFQIPPLVQPDSIAESSSAMPFASLNEATSPELVDPTAILDATIGASIVPDTIISTGNVDGSDPIVVNLESVDIAQSLVENSKKEEDDEIQSPQAPPAAATQQQHQQKQLQMIEAPSVLKILKFAIPAIGVWLCSPVLSMIDTASVGLLSGTAQQAALNPAVSVTDMGALAVAFMYTATTNLIAAAQQNDSTSPNSQDSPRTTKTLVTSLRLALIVGSIFGIFLTFSANTLIRSLIGNDSLDPTVMSAALRYVRIRCLGMPAAVVIGTAQSACLGMQDVKSPLYVLLAAALINFCGDVLLVGNTNPWLGGAAGAAWATVFSQYGALFMFWRWMTTKPKERTRKGKSADSGNDVGEVVDITKGIMEMTGTSEEGKSRRKQFRKFLLSSKLSMKSNLLQSKPSSLATLNDVNNDVNSVKTQPHPKARGFLSDGKLRRSNFFRLSNLDVPTAREFLPFVIPVTTTSIGRISGYIAMSHVASSTLGTFDMAAHQIIFSIFCCLTPIVDALNQVAQSFVPGIFELKEKSDERAKALKQTINNFRKCGVGFGAFLVALVSLIPWFSNYFTTDPSVLASVCGAIPGMGLFLALHGLSCGGEGSLLGQKDLKFLRNMYAIYFFTVPAYMLRLKRRSLAGIQSVGIGTMWAAFSGYQVIRTIIWHVRLAQLQRRTDQGVVKKDA